MVPFVFRATQLVPRPLSEVFAFFSRAEHLQELTPPWLQFHILSVEPNPVRQGTRICYRLRWRVFPIHWTSEILQWEPPHRFVDLQLRGPYRLWRHEHRFTAQGGSTLIEDEVHYSLPLGPAGRLAHRVKVRGDIEAIFAYRQQAIRHIFAEAA